MKRYGKLIFFHIVVFVLVVALTVWADSRAEAGSAVSVRMESPTLPVVFAQSGDLAVNPLHGYVQEMRQAFVHAPVTPLSEDLSLLFQVRAAGGVKGASYRIWSEDMSRLVEEGTAQKEEDAEGLRLLCRLQNLYQTGSTYRMALTLDLGEKSAVYYTRLYRGTGEHDAQMFAFARFFSDNSFAEDGGQALIPYLETDTSADPQTLADVNIHSTLGQIAWGSLDPVKSNDEEIYITELGDTYASYVFRYTVTAPGTGGRTASYRVREAYTIRWSSVRCYVMDFSRTMDEIFRPELSSGAGTTLDLGIRSDGDVTAATAANGNYICLIENGDLWIYDRRGGQLSRVFSFAEEEDMLRSGYDAHGLRLVRTGTDGSCDFAVYGYFNRGPHEGTCGMALYHYDRSGRALSETFFVPSDVPYEVMAASLDQFFYVTEDGVLYWLQDGAVRSLDFDGGECSSLTGPLSRGSMAAAADRSALAWTEGDDPRRAASMTVLYLKDAVSRTVTAPAGMYLQPVAFLGEDLVYGLAAAGDVPEDAYDAFPFPMTRLMIVSKEGQTIGAYDPPGVYVTGAQTAGTRLALTRAIKTETGFAETTPDALIQSDPEAPKETTPLKTAQDSKRMKVTQLTLSSDAPVRSFSVTATRTFTYDAARILVPDTAGDTGQQYFAWARGRLCGIHYRIADAVAQVYTRMGSVTDASGRVVWTRQTRPAELTISFTEYPTGETVREAETACLQMMIQRGGTGIARDLMRDHGNLFDALSAATGGRALRLSGLTAAQLINGYLSAGTPVFARLADGSPQLIIGYDAFNVVLYNPQTGVTYKMGQETAQNTFETAGSFFIGFLPQK